MITVIRERSRIIQNSGPPTPPLNKQNKHGLIPPPRSMCLCNTWTLPYACCFLFCQALSRSHHHQLPQNTGPPRQCSAKVITVDKFQNSPILSPIGIQNELNKCTVYKIQKLDALSVHGALCALGGIKEPKMFDSELTPTLSNTLCYPDSKKVRMSSELFWSGHSKQIQPQNTKEMATILIWIKK